jgi:hypothetical protein
MAEDTRFELVRACLLDAKDEEIHLEFAPSVVVQM